MDGDDAASVRLKDLNVSDFRFVGALDEAVPGDGLTVPADDNGASCSKLTQAVLNRFACSLSRFRAFRLSDSRSMSFK